MLWRLPLGPTPLPMLYTLIPSASHSSRILMNPSAVACWTDGARLTHPTPSCFRYCLCSGGTVAPELAAILIPGGIGVSFASAFRVAAMAAAPAIAALAKSRLSILVPPLASLLHRRHSRHGWRQIPPDPVSQLLLSQRAA